MPIGIVEKLIITNGVSMIVNLCEEYLNDFKSYCLLHRKDHDETYLSDEDIEDFSIGSENPTTLSIKDKKIIGVCSFVIDEYQLKANKARARIFHCESNKQDEYEELFNALPEFPNSVHSIFLFIPSDKKLAFKAFLSLNFSVERYSAVLVRTNKEPLSYSFPENYSLDLYKSGIDENDYLTVRNSAFKNIKGSEAAMSKDMLIKQMSESNIIKNGTFILRYKETAVGLISMSLENEEGKDYSFVSPIALVKEHQGKGLGKNILRAGIKAGAENGYNDCMLSVNSENENAVKLYINEGFEKIVDMVCLQYTMN